MSALGWVVMVVSFDSMVVDGLDGASVITVRLFNERVSVRGRLMKVRVDDDRSSRRSAWFRSSGLQSSGVAPLRAVEKQGKASGYENSKRQTLLVCVVDAGW